MTPFEAFEAEQNRQFAQDQIAQALYLDGSTDAATGASPQSQDETYISGYLAGLKAMILDGSYTLQIRWLSQSYLSGGFDGDEF
jgi:hypothetical protein